MDMKRILQAMDGVTSKPVEGAEGMAKFLRIVKEGDINQPAQEGILGSIKDAVMGKSPEEWAKTSTQMAALLAMRAQYPNNSELEQRIGDLKFRLDQGNGEVMDYDQKTGQTFPKVPVAPKTLKESTRSPSVAEQMITKQYSGSQQTLTERKPSLFKSYYQSVEETQFQKKNQKNELISQYAQHIAERVLMKESVLREDKDPCWDNYKMVGTKKKGKKTVPNCVPKNENTISGHTMGYNPQGPGMGNYVVDEAPIAMDPAEPNNPTIHGHQQANPMTLKGRILSARAQLKELAQLAESDNLLAWEQICQKAKGGMFMGLDQNIEQIRHAIAELAAKRRKGGVASRGIDKNIGEQSLTPEDLMALEGLDK